MSLDCTLQPDRAKPGASEKESDSPVEGWFGSHARGTAPVIIQAIIKITSETKIVPHLALVGTLEVQQVNGDISVFGRHGIMVSQPYDNRWPCTCAVKKRLTADRPTRQCCRSSR